MIVGVATAIVMWLIAAPFFYIASKVNNQQRASIRKWFGVLTALTLIAVIGVSFNLGKENWKDFNTAASRDVGISVLHDDIVEQHGQKKLTIQNEQKASAVQEEIDKNQILKYWQDNNPNIWQKCVELDNELRSDPETASLSMSNRFAKVAAAMVEVYGNPIKTDVRVDTSDINKLSRNNNNFYKCNKSVSDTNANFPMQIDAETTIVNASCVEDGSRIVIIYTHRTNHLKSFYQSTIESLREEKVNFVCTNPETKAIHSLFDFEYKYYDSSNSYMGAIRVRKEDCR
jgi:hypothetical protein